MNSDMNGFQLKVLLVINGTLNVRAEKHKDMPSVHILDTISLTSKLKMSVLPARNLPVQVISLPTCSEWGKNIILPHVEQLHYGT
jgi:hypothetical protein